MGKTKYDCIETYLNTHFNIHLSDVLYKPEHCIDFDCEREIQRKLKNKNRDYER